MRLFAFILISFLFFTLTSSKEERAVHRQRKDLRILFEAIQQKEGKIDIHVSEDSITNTFDRAMSELDYKRSFIDLFKLFSSAVATLQCGHTDLTISGKVINEWARLHNSLPIDYVLYGKKLFVHELDKADTKYYSRGLSKKEYKTIPKHAEIIRIDGKNTSEWLDEFGVYVPSDEGSKDFKYYKAGQLFEFYRTIISESKDSIEVVFSKNHDTSHIFLKLGYPPVRTLLKRLLKFEKEEQKKYGDIGKFSFVKSKIAYFRFTSFKECKGKRYAEFLEKSFKQIKEKKADKLIVDVRGNLGGQLQILFMSYILGENVFLGKYELNKPFEWFKNKRIAKFNENFKAHKRLTRRYAKFKTIHPNFTGELFTTKINKEYQFKGEIIVVTDEGSFSAASILACHLKTLAKAKIVGQTAGGSFYSGNAGTLQVKLPYTGFSLIVNPNTFYTHLSIHEGQNPVEIKTPDFELEPINPKVKKQDIWYVNNVCKFF